MGFKTMEYGVSILAIAALLSACGGGGGGVASSTTPATGATATTTITGVASKGPLNGAIVTAYAINASGVPSTTPLPASAVTQADGSYALTISYSGPVMLTVTNGVYTDEATGISNVPLTSTLRSVLASASGVSSVAAITPLSEAAVQNASAAGGLTLANISNEVAKIQSSVGFDPIATKPANALDPASANAKAEEKLYAAYLGGVSHYIKNQKLTGANKEANAAKDFAAKLKAGALGALAATDPVRKAVDDFSNNVNNQTGLGNAVALNTLGITLSNKKAPRPEDEIKATIQAFNDLYATKRPAPTDPDLGNLLATSYKHNGNDRATELNNLTSASSVAPGMKITGGGLAPWDLSPLSASAVGATNSPGTAIMAADVLNAVTQRAAIFRTGNCITSVWAYISINGAAPMPMQFTRSIADTTTCAGKPIALTNGKSIVWQLNGNQRDIVTSVIPAYSYVPASGVVAASYNRLLQIKVDPKLSGVTSVTLISNGISNGPVTLSGSVTTPFVISAGTGYGGADNLLQSCADTAALAALFPKMPCFDPAAAAVAKGDLFAFAYADPATKALTYQVERIASAPVAKTALTAAQFPSAVTPSMTLAAFSTALNAAAGTATTPITVTAKLPNGYMPLLKDVFFYNVTAGLVATTSLATSTFNAASGVQTINATVAKPATPVTNNSLINILVGGKAADGQVYFTQQRMQ